MKMNNDINKSKYIKTSVVCGIFAVMALGCGDPSNMNSTKATTTTSSVSDVLEAKAQEASTDTSQEAVSSITVPAPQVDSSEPVYKSEPDASVDVDLTAMSSTMVYSEVFQMCYYPENYIGKTVKMDGFYDVYQDETSGKVYYACIIQDATACCAQGIEFQLAGNNYPDETVTEVTVKGTFDIYEENGTKYCTLKDSELISCN